MAADSLEIAPLEEVPTGEVLALLETCLGPGAVERDEAFWRWKHEANPFGRSPGVVALDRGRPVALRVFLRWHWTAGGQDVEAVRAVDTATHPAWRRRGLFRRLTLELLERARADGTAFVFNTPNPRSRPGYLAMGWEDVGRLPLLVRLRRPVRALRGTFRGTSPREDASLATPQGLGAVDELLEEPALPELLAAWNAGDGRLHTPRTPQYLRWRYESAPGLSYRALWRLQGSSGAVVVARARRRRGLHELTLSEVLVSDDPAGREAVRTLLEEVGALPWVDYLAAVAAPGTVERKVLRQAAWLPVPAGPRLVVRLLRDGDLDPWDPDPRNPASWRPSIGDLELF